MSNALSIEVLNSILGSKSKVIDKDSVYLRNDCEWGVAKLLHTFFGGSKEVATVKASMFVDSTLIFLNETVNVLLFPSKQTGVTIFWEDYAINTTGYDLPTCFLYRENVSFDVISSFLIISDGVNRIRLELCVTA